MRDLFYLKDVILFEGKFYAEEKQLANFNFDKRSSMMSPIEVFPFNLLPKTLDLSDLPSFSAPVVNHLHHNNMLHNLWDGLYPSWFYMFHSLREKCFEDYVPIFLDYHRYGASRWHDMFKTFSGNQIHSQASFARKFSTPVKISYLFPIIAPASLNHASEKLYSHYGRDLLTETDEDPVDTFVNRMYKRYGIKRNENINNLNKIYFIKNKRPYHGIEKIFEELNAKYKNKYNFEIIDFNDYQKEYKDADGLDVGYRGRDYFRDTEGKLGKKVTDDFEKQLHLFNSCRMMICGPSTGRSRCPLAPHGAIEVQLHEHGAEENTLIMRDNTQMSSCSRYLKIENIPSYSSKENNQQLCPSNLKFLIEKNLESQPINVPVSIESNQHPLVQDLIRNPEKLKHNGCLSKNCPSAYFYLEK